MILNRSKQYALLALIDLATQPPKRYTLSRDLSRRLGIPSPYLSKVMQQLVQCGILESVRGRGGGFRLALPPDQVTIRDVMQVMDKGQAGPECLMGLKACSEEGACALHCQWMPVKKGIFHLLEQQTLAHLCDEGR